MRFSSLAILIFVVASSADAQRAPQPGDTAKVREQLLAIESDIAKANRDCDYKYFDRIEATEFIFTGANGQRFTKKEDLAGEKDCRKSTVTQTLDEVVVQLHGNVAVLSARSTMAARRSRFTDVFVWRDGRWQLVAGHSSRIQQ